MIVTASVTSRLVLIKKCCLSVCLSMSVCLYVNRFSLSLSSSEPQQWLSVVLVQLKKAGKRPDMSEKILTGTYCMSGSRNFCQVGGGGGGGVSRPDCQKTALTTFFLVLNLFYSFTVVYQWFISKKTIISRGFRGVKHFSGGGGQTFSRGGGGWSNFFQGGLNANLYRTYDFQGVRTPYPPLWIRTCTGISSKTNEHPSTCLHFKNKAKSSCMITIFIERQRYTFMNLN